MGTKMARARQRLKVNLNEQIKNGFTKKSACSGHIKTHFARNLEVNCFENRPSDNIFHVFIQEENSQIFVHTQMQYS